MSTTNSYSLLYITTAILSAGQHLSLTMAQLVARNDHPMACLGEEVLVCNATIGIYHTEIPFLVAYFYWHTHEAQPV